MLASHADIVLARHAIFPPQRTPAKRRAAKRVDQSQRTFQILESALWSLRNFKKFCANETPETLVDPKYLHDL